jgi:hypothetical protein
MNFGEVLSRAWQIIWKHKVLWLFGIMAGCAGSGGGSPNIQYSFSRDLPPQIGSYFEQFPVEQIPLWIGLALVVILFMVAVSVFFGTIGRIGVIRGTLQIEASSSRLSFSELFRGSLPYFWRVFALVLIVSITIALVALIVMLPIILLSVVTFGFALLCFIPLLCLLIPLAWIVEAYIELGIVSIVADNLGVMAGLQRAWELVSKNFGPVLLMALILILGIGTIGGFIIFGPLLLALTPLLSIIIFESSNVVPFAALVSILCLVIYLPVLLVLSGMLRSYINTAWTLTYLRLTPILSGRETTTL